MAHAICIETGRLALNLHGLLRTIDPARWREDAEAAARARLLQIREDLSSILRRYAEPLPDGKLAVLYEGLRRLADVIEPYRGVVVSAEDGAAREGSEGRIAVQWAQLRARLQPAYAAIAAALDRLAVPVPALRPTNYARNLFHFGSGVFCLLLLQLLLTEATMAYAAVSCALFCWTAEALRVRYPIVTRAFMAVLGRAAHPHEHHAVNSGTWFVTALGLLSLCCTPRVATAAIMVLAVGDPLGALIGRRFGKTVIRAGRTVEGSLAFVAAGAVATAATLMIFYPALRTPLVAVVALLAALGGAIAELNTRRLDDNLTIPLGAALGAAVGIGLMGL